MAINIKNVEAQRLTYELARLTGETVTTAVTVAVSERLDRLHHQRSALTPEERTAEITRLGAEIAAALGVDALRIEDLYDESAGLPR